MSVSVNKLAQNKKLLSNKNHTEARQKRQISEPGQVIGTKPLHHWYQSVPVYQRKITNSKHKGT
jgi:hypothetical protein